MEMEINIYIKRSCEYTVLMEQIHNNEANLYKHNMPGLRVKLLLIWSLAPTVGVSKYLG